MTTKGRKPPWGNQLPVQVSPLDFNRYLDRYLSQPVKGPKPKLSKRRIFNYILYVLHTGCQWSELKTRRNELHWSNVYKWHNRWSKDGSYARLFSQSILFLDRAGQLDLSIIHGDGSNTVAKKGGQESAILDTNSKRA